MSDVAALLELALSPQRSTVERLRSLAELRPLLYAEAAARELMAAARAEASVEVRGAFLDALLGVDVTRLSDRAVYIDGLAYFAGLEPEGDLRVRAIARLGELAEGEEIVAETLTCDLDERVQHACLEALHRVTRKSGKTVDALLAYGARAPRALRPALVGLYAGLGSPQAQAGLASLLNPWEDEALQAAVLAELAKSPTLAPAAAAAIGAYLAMHPREPLEAQALDVLLSRTDADPGLLEAILRGLQDTPEQAQLAGAFRDRLASMPQLVSRLAALVATTPSARLKLALMELLAGTPVPDLFVALLRDAHPWVREAAVAWCAEHVTEHAKVVTEGLAAAIPQEPLRGVRHAMVRAFLESKRKGADVERLLVEWFEREADPRIQETLGAVLPTISITDENRAAILRAYRKVLTEPLFDAGVKAVVTQRLRSFAYRDEPELVACLRSLLERATEIEQVEELHVQLRRLDPDLDVIAPTLLKLFYRFLHHFPRDPLHGWLRDLKEAASRLDEVRAQIPYLARISGASWILEGADTQGRKRALLPAFMDAVRQDAFRGPQRLLDEAYQSRTLRRSDLIAIFEKLLDWPGQDALLQQVFKIMRDANLVTPEIVDRCFRTLLNQPTSDATGEIQEFIRHAGPRTPGYREKVVSLFTQEGYSRYCLMSGGPRDIRDVPRTWHDWEWENWRLMHDGWPIASLYLELDPRPEMRALIGSPPAEGVPAVQTIHYVVLEHWWRTGVGLEEEDYRALGRLFRATAGSKPMEPLRDRALCLFARRWNEWVERALRGRPVPDDLRAMAAEAYAELCRLHATYGKGEKEQYPKPLRGLDVTA